MKLIEVARRQKDLLNEGIAYIAVWQEAQRNGRRSWFTEDIFPAGGVDRDEPIFDDEQKARLAEIAELDENAILLNGYLHSWIGSADEPLNAASIAVGIEKHYTMYNALVKNYLADISEIKVAAPNAPETIAIELPTDNVKTEVLTALLNSKAGLIRAALGNDCAREREYGADGLPIEFADGKVSFKWLKVGADSEAVTAWREFLAAAVNFSKTAKRITAKDRPVDNEKFTFRTFMVRLGMNDAANKNHRKYLLRNLSGDGAFATPESKAKWQAKHLKNSGAESGNGVQTTNKSANADQPKGNQTMENTGTHVGNGVTHTETYYFPLQCTLWRRDEGGNWDDLTEYPTELSGRDALNYKDDIEALLEIENATFDTPRLLAEYLHDDTLGAKVYSMTPAVEERGDTLWGTMKMEMCGELTDGEVERHKEYIIGQNADGFGEGLEQRETDTPDGELYVHFWHSGSDYAVYTPQEFAALTGHTQSDNAPAKHKPTAPIIGADSNVFNLIGIVGNALKRAGLRDEAAEMRERVLSSGGYDNALAIMAEYVEPVEADEPQSGMKMSM